MSAENKSGRVIYFDLLRVFAAFSVIVIHVSVVKFDTVETGSVDWWVCSAYDSVCRWAVPVFVMISGALFLDPARPVVLKTLFRKNLLRIVCAFLFWSSVYTLIDYFSGVRLRDVAFNFITGHMHLWFLYMIAGLYLIVPLLRKLTESERLTKYYMIVWAVFCILFRTFRLFAAVGKDYFGYWIDLVSDRIDLDLVAGYAGYFILGRVLHTREVPKKMRAVFYALGVFGAASTCLMTMVATKRSGALDLSFFDDASVFVAFEAVAVFVFFKYRAPVKKHESNRKFLGVLSGCTFGIYLIHMLPVDHLERLLPFSVDLGGTLVSIPLLALAAFLISFLLTFILKKIPFINRYIV